MTTREKFLLRALLVSILAALGLWTVQFFLDEVSRLDSRFVFLKTQAAQIQAKMLSGSSVIVDRRAVSSQRFWPPGSLPDPLVLAGEIKPLLNRAGAEVKDFRVLSSSAEQFRLQYTLEAPMDAFVKAMVHLQSSNPRILIYKFSSRLKHQDQYFIVWELGYATLP